MEALLAWDRSLLLQINQGLAAPWLDVAFLAVTALGHGLTVAVIALPLVWIWDRPRFWRVVGLATLALAAGGLLALAIKHGVGRPRPIADPALAGARVRVLLALASKSFPSGHAQTAAGAVVIFGLLYRRLHVIAPLSLLALLVGLSRIYLGVHFPLDVLAGLVLGATVSLAAWFALGARFGLRARGDPG